jgi:hypothetical protein
MAPSKKLPTWRPTSRLICTTPPASIAGSAMMASRFMSGVSRGMRGSARNPAGAAATQTSAS